jgi:PAS domain S-box-containing protein
MAARRADASGSEPRPGPLEFISRFLASDRDGLLAVDPRLRLILWNPVMEAITGVKRSEAVGASALALFPALVDTGDVQYLRAAIDGRYSVAADRTYGDYESGHPGPYEVYYAPLHGDREVVGAFAVLRHARQRDAVEQRLREVEGRFRTMADSAPVLLWMAGADAMCDFFNQTWLRFTGRTLAQELGLGWAEGVHPEDLQCCMDTYMAAFNARRPFEMVYRLRRADGEYRWVLDHGAPRYTADGLFEGFIGSSVDITERIRAEEAQARLEVELRQAQKMDALGRLAGGIAHDFNNLLTVITGRAELLLDRLPVGDPSRRAVELIRLAGERAAGLTRRLLAFSRKQVLQRRVLDLNEMVSGMGEMLRRLIGEDVELVTVLPPGVGRVRVDPGQLEQVLVNLAVNARDAMPRGGRLRIEAGRADLDPETAAGLSVAPGPHVFLRISDTGSGMDAETRARIFDPFFTTKESDKGTGLGLCIVYGIVRQHDGAITVDSSPGQGTSFAIHLPCVEDAVTTGAATAPPAARPEGATILLIEDELAVRALAEEVLRTHGYDVIVAGSGDEALRIADQHPRPIHLVITDVVMPRMSGPEVVERLLRLRPGTKVLYMSGYTDQALEQRGVPDTQRGFIQKPSARPRSPGRWRLSSGRERADDLPRRAGPRDVIGSGPPANGR